MAAYAICGLHCRRMSEDELEFMHMNPRTQRGHFATSFASQGKYFVPFMHDE